ncbi:restriction endonuclease subunit M [Flavobacterium sediminis]|uniref:site-specific DNA-methyltransferase (adenine-specific) n=1 Tax=Flavobacterium sediminis TaxID=2201181 RepID=A0A2U8QVI3_9FLAO|nr:N-6 DNA methylase [Flavobacterium sediminis]AWM14207.1 restriction endonuclease subunit M [Flavobacterium sediminis]
MSLFQNAVVTKYLQAINQDSINQKWNEFTTYFHNPERQENIRNSKEEQYQEGFLRELFVKILGYTLNPEPNFNLTTEYKNVKDSKKADGAILVDNKVRGVIELKGTNTTDLGKIEVQAFGYKNNQPDCTYVITSNFEKIRFYIDNAIEHLEFNLFTLTEAEFKILYLCLAVENISKDIAKKVKEESVSQEDVITKKLYKDYSLFKRELFKNLVELNPQFDQLELFKKSQKLLDRFLFIFFAEDRMLLPPNSVRLILNQWKQLEELDAYAPLYDRFKLYFGYLNTGHKGKNYDVYAYNGGLFKPDDILDNITIDDKLLYEHTLKLSEYDFVSEVDVNILGHIFENSLNELDEIKAQLEGQEIDKTKTKRKKDGVFYTPKYITKYIVENTISKLCEEKKLELAINEEDYITDKKRQKKTIKDLVDKLDTYRKWLLQLTICDPACGSGAFLNQALDFLIEEHQYIDELQAKLFGDALVLTDMENSILENNLFGVDLNEESVEIAKLSLWLRTAQPNRKLNDLSGNIKCGNSLIDDPEIAGDKAFNWQNAFPKVFEKGGFDVIIGNPPYVDIKGLNKDDVKFYFDKYSTTENRINLYSIFIEKGLGLINQYGVLSYINPNSMLVNSSYFKLRKLILPYLKKIIKLPDNVFEDAKVETIIFELFKNNLSKEINVINYSKDERINFIDESRTIKYLSTDWEKDSNLNFNLYASKSELNLINKIEKLNIITLNQIADFTLGITPYDKYKGHSQEIIKSRAYHSVIKIDDSYKPLITGENIIRYFVSPEIKEYIKYGDWLGAKREERFFINSRILIRQIVSGNPPRIYCGYTEEELYFTQIGFGIISKNQEEFANKYILTLLNSKLLNFYHKYKFLDLEKDLFQKVLIANCKELPILKATLSEQLIFVDKADLMLLLNKELKDSASKFQRTLQRKFELESLPKKLESWYELTFAEFVKELSKKKIKLSLSEEAEWEDYFLQEQQKALALKQQITTTDKEIDKMVYELYGLTDDEISIVENS